MATLLEQLDEAIKDGKIIIIPTYHTYDKYLEIIVRDNIDKQERKFTISLHTDVIRTI